MKLNKKLFNFVKKSINYSKNFKNSSFKALKKNDMVTRIISLNSEYRKKIRKKDIIQIACFVFIILYICIVINRFSNTPKGTVKNFFNLIAQGEYKKASMYLEPEGKEKVEGHEKQSLSIYIRKGDEISEDDIYLLDSKYLYIDYSIPILNIGLRVKEKKDFLIFIRYEIVYDFTWCTDIPYNEEYDKFEQEGFKEKPQNTMHIESQIITIPDKAYEETVKAFKEAEIFYINNGEVFFLEKDINDFYKERYKRLKKLRSELKSAEIEEFYIEDINKDTDKVKVTVNAKFKYIYNDSKEETIVENIVYTVVITDNKYLVIDEKVN